LRRAAAFALLLLASGAAVKLLTERPTGRGDWSQDTAVLAESELRGGVLRLRRVRDFRYKSTKEWTARWYDAEYRFDELESVWLGVEPFGLPGAAHVFLSFCFKGWRCLAVSAEIRKRRGDSFSAARGLFNAYELAYIVADERDVVGLRAAHRRHPVYLFRARSDAAGRTQLLLDMLERGRRLRERPEFYNTLTNTCATSVLRHVRRVSPGRVSWGPSVLFPSRAGRLAYELGFLDASGSYEEEAARRLVDAAAAADTAAPDYSARIRR
jgi:hypothetical protein